jgi:hypothetical protein
VRGVDAPIASGDGLTFFDASPIGERRRRPVSTQARRDSSKTRRETTGARRVSSSSFAVSSESSKETTPTRSIPADSCRGGAEIGSTSVTSSKDRNDGFEEPDEPRLIMTEGRRLSGTSRREIAEKGEETTDIEEEREETLETLADIEKAITQHQRFSNQEKEFSSCPPSSPSNIEASPP